MSFSLSRRVCAAVALCLLIVGGLAYPGHAVAQPERLCFPETDFCIEGRFRAHWEQQGGLPVFGFPTSPPHRVLNLETGQSYLTQWFERNRFELHPENQPPYDVLLGRLGTDRLNQQGRDWWAFPKADPDTPHFFPETNQAIAEEFWPYWSSHGLEFDGRASASFAESLALFGMPISPLQDEHNPADGRSYQVQWFERARFEWHPEYSRVLLGLLGNELHGQETLYEDFEDGSRLIWWSPDPDSFALTPSVKFASSGQTALEISYQKVDTFQLFAAELPAGQRNLRSFTRLHLMVKGPVTLLLKFEDEQGRSQDITTASTAEPDEWNLLRFDLTDAGNAVDLSVIKNLFFFPAPGNASANGTIYIDDLTLVQAP